MYDLLGLKVVTTQNLAHDFQIRHRTRDFYLTV